MSLIGCLFSLEDVGSRIFIFESGGEGWVEKNYNFCFGKLKRGSSCFYLKLVSIYLKWYLSKLDFMNNCVFFFFFGRC